MPDKRPTARERKVVEELACIIEKGLARFSPAERDVRFERICRALDPSSRSSGETQAEPIHTKRRKVR